MPCFCVSAADFAEVGHRDRLAAGHVHGGRQAEIGHMLPAYLADQALQGVQIDIALEGMRAERVVGLGNDHVDEGAAGQFLVQPGGGEIHVARHVVAGLDQHAGEDVLGPAALVRGHGVAVAVIVCGRPLRDDRSSCCRRRPRRRASCRPTASRSWRWCRYRSRDRCRRPRTAAGRCCSRLRQWPLSRWPRLVIFSGSTTLTFQGSAQERRDGRLAEFFGSVDIGSKA